MPCGLLAIRLADRAPCTELTAYGDDGFRSRYLSRDRGVLSRLSYATNESPQKGSNLRPSRSKRDTLPLSYGGKDTSVPRRLVIPYRSWLQGMFDRVIQSLRWVTIPLPLPYQGSTLPIELRRLEYGCRWSLADDADAIHNDGRQIALAEDHRPPFVAGTH